MLLVRVEDEEDEDGDHTEDEDEDEDDEDKDVLDVEKVVGWAEELVEVDDGGGGGGGGGDEEDEDDDDDDGEDDDEDDEEDDEEPLSESPVEPSRLKATILATLPFDTVTTQKSDPPAPVADSELMTPNPELLEGLISQGNPLQPPPGHSIFSP